MHLRSDKLDAATAAFQKALEFLQPLAKKHPDNVRLQRELANAYSGLGDVLLQSGRPSEAAKQFRMTHSIRKRLVQHAAEDGNVQCDLSRSYDKLGDEYLRTNRIEAAATAFQEAFKIREQLSFKQPNPT